MQIFHEITQLYSLHCSNIVYNNKKFAKSEFKNQLVPDRVLAPIKYFAFPPIVNSAQPVDGQKNPESAPIVLMKNNDEAKSPWNVLLLLVVFTTGGTVILCYIRKFFKSYYLITFF